MFLEFHKHFNKSIVFSVKDIEKAFPGFNKMNLVNWQKNDHILKLRNGWYRFNEKINNEEEYFYIANKIYDPSYVSLESALSYYGLIPEGVFTISSISTLKTHKFDTSVGSFKFQNIKPSSFFGYRLIKYAGAIFKIAEPEKALMDYLFLQTSIKTYGDIEELRINKIVLKKKTDSKKMQDIALRYNSKVLIRKTALLIKYMND